MRSWPALIVAPLAALASIGFGYALVTPACERSQGWLLHAAILLCLVVAAACTGSAWAALHRARRELLPLVATWTGAFFSLVIAMQWAAQLFISPCMH